MNTPNPTLHDAALRRAAELRTQAFDAAFDSGAAALRRALRSATRLAASLKRHHALRSLEA